MGKVLVTATEEESDKQKREAAAGGKLFGLGLVLRFVVILLTLAPVIDMVTSKQTIVYQIPSSDPLSLVAKFTYSPALLYYVVAMTLACLYSLIVVVVLGLAACRKIYPSLKLLLYLAILDTLMVGVVASATGAATAIADIGLHGNSHVGWSKICDMFGGFCRHVGSSVFVSVIAGMVLVLLVMISTYSLYIQAPSTTTFNTV